MCLFETKKINTLILKPYRPSTSGVNFIRIESVLTHDISLELVELLDKRFSSLNNNRN